MPYGIVLVGCGWVAEEYIKAVQADGRAEIKGLVNRSLQRPLRYKDQYRLACDIEDKLTPFLDREDIHAVIVATPHNQHTPYVLEAAEAGKHVIIEKPVALSMDEVRQQEAALSEAGVKSLVSFVLHWNPLLQTARHLLDKGAFGNVFMIEVDYFHRIWGGDRHWLHTREAGGTSMLAAGCHAVDALRWFAGATPVEVSAYQTQTENPNEYPGTNTAIVRFENGVIGRATSCFDAQMPYVFHIGIYGTEGSMRNDQVYAPNYFPGQQDFMRIPTILPDSGDVAHHPFFGELQHFLDCIEQDARPQPNIEDAAITMALCFAADRAAEQLRPVPLTEITSPKGD